MPTRISATTVVKKLTQAGHIAYFAGGWVRDFLMQCPSHDIDIATSASVEEVQALFPKTIPVGVAFGIVIVVQDHHHFEVASFRKDRGYIDGRRPSSIEPATPEEDAQRRDFTINGMFYDPLQNKLFDYVKGQEDIQAKIIRAIGDPHERFLEDRLRMMRAVRYATRFDFLIEQKTLSAILSHSESLLPSVAMERVWQEFKKMSQFAHFDEGLIMLHELNLLPTIFPSLRTLSVDELKVRVKAIEHFPKGAPTISELLELFPSTSLEEWFTLCDYLKLSKEDKRFVEFYHHINTQLNMPKEWLEKLEPVEWAQTYAHPHSELCLQIFAAHLPIEQKEAFLNHHLKKAEQLNTAIVRIRTKKPVITAGHLIEKGIKPGVEFGKLLKEAERISVNDDLEEPSEVLCKLEKTPLWKNLMS